MHHGDWNRRMAIGVRIGPAGVEPVDAQDATFDRTFWFDLRTRHPVAARTKRAMDVAGSLALIGLTAPLWLSIAAMLALTGDGRVLVTRQAHGFRCNPYAVPEFRSGPGRMRRLPRLLCVLRGTMSLVGPAPMFGTDAVMSAGMRRFAVLPGLISLAEVSGAATEEERMRLDRQYVNEWSLRLDVAILRRAITSGFPF